MLNSLYSSKIFLRQLSGCCKFPWTPNDPCWSRNRVPKVLNLVTTRSECCKPPVPPDGEIPENKVAKHNIKKNMKTHQCVRLSRPHDPCKKNVMKQKDVYRVCHPPPPCPPPIPPQPQAVNPCQTLPEPQTCQTKTPQILNPCQQEYQCGHQSYAEYRKVMGQKISVCDHPKRPHRAQDPCGYKARLLPPGSVVCRPIQDCPPRRLPPNPCAPIYPHKNGWMKFRNFVMFVSMPIIVILSACNLSEPIKHKKDCPPYEYLHMRTKRFPWGDGVKSLFHNDHTNWLPNECMEDIKRRREMKVIKNDSDKQEKDPPENKETEGKDPCKVHPDKLRRECLERQEKERYKRDCQA